MEGHIFKCGALQCHANEYIIYITCTSPNDKDLSDKGDDKYKCVGILHAMNISSTAKYNDIAMY